MALRPPSRSLEITIGQGQTISIDLDHREVVRVEVRYYEEIREQGQLVDSGMLIAGPTPDYIEAVERSN